MNVYEMEGFLRGKCMPRDILVNESTAAYLVRKLNEATAVKADRNALERQLLMSEAKCKGYFSEAATALVKCDALAVENAALKDAIPRLKDIDYSNDSMDDVSLAEDIGFNEAVTQINNMVIKTPATDAALAAIEARFCGLLDNYGKVEPEKFNPEFANLYAKIANRIFSSVMDNPSVTDLESLTNWLESSAENARAYADMSIKFHAELREAK